MQMRFENLEKMTEAPDRGQMLAYTQKQVIFRPYENLDKVRCWLADNRILELHLFDQCKEYRAIETRSPRFQNGIIETIADFREEDQKELYTEVVTLEDKFGTAIAVLNHIHYDETGMADIDNCRLKMRRID